MVAQPNPPEADLLPHSRYTVALERQIETLNFMRTMKPFNTVARVVSRERGRRNAAENDYRLDIAVAEALERAQPYLWGREMVDLLEANVNALEEWTLHKTDVHHPFGYIWFERPLQIFRDDPEEIRAFCWEPIERGGKRQAPLFAGGPGLGLGHRYNELVGSEEGYLVTAFTGYPAGTNQGLPSMNVATGSPRTPIFWPVNSTLSEFIGGIKEHYENPEFRRQVQVVAGLPPLRHAAQMTEFARIFAACTALINQKITRIAGAPADRPARRRAQAILKRPDVPLTRVVLLRQIEYIRTGEASEPGEGVDWAYRWTVKGHWRKQWYPSENRHKSIYVHGYVKGPANRPFKPGGIDITGVVR